MFYYIENVTHGEARHMDSERDKHTYTSRDQKQTTLYVKITDKDLQRTIYKSLQKVT